MSYKPTKLTRFNYLKFLWSIADQYHHCIDTEFMALSITQRQTCLYYCKELAYITTVIAAKLCEDGGGLNSIHNIPRKYQQLDLYQLEKDILMNIHFHVYDNHIVNQINDILIDHKINKKLSDSFVLLLRYLVWCDIKGNLLTIILALHLNKKCYHHVDDILYIIKYYKTYNILEYVSLLTDFHVKDLILEYNKIKKII